MTYYALDSHNTQRRQFIEVLSMIQKF